jgi:hypothetical protein
MANAVAISCTSAPVRYEWCDKMLLNSAWRHGRSGQFSDDRDRYTKYNRTGN